MGANEDYTHGLTIIVYAVLRSVVSAVQSIQLLERVCEIFVANCEKAQVDISNAPWGKPQPKTNDPPPRLEEPAAKKAKGHICTLEYTDKGLSQESLKELGFVVGAHVYAKSAPKVMYKLTEVEEETCTMELLEDNKNIKLYL